MSRSELAEVHEADTTWTQGGNFLRCDPAINRAPVVERHVVRPVRSDGAKIADEIRSGAVADKYSATDEVGRAGWNGAIAVHGTAFEPLHVEPSTLISRTADQDPTAQDGCALSADRDFGKV